MNYREFLNLTDDEIRFIVNDIFSPAEISNIQRHITSNTITCDITTGGWDNREEAAFEITDELELGMPSTMNCGINVDFSISVDDITKWKKFLLAKGCNELLKDNPYL